MEKTEISEIQKQFWILQHLYPDTTAYNLPYVATISGELNLKALEYAVNQVVVRYDMLRTCFIEEDGKVYQQVNNPVDGILKVDVIKVNDEFLTDPFPVLISDEIHKIFDLTTWPLFRIKLFVFSNTTVITIIFNHIIVDMQSIEVFFKDLSGLYKSYYLSTSPDLDVPVNNYSDYTLWYKDWISSGKSERKIEEWKSIIPNKPEKLELFSALTHPKVSNLEGQRIHLKLDKFTLGEISAFAGKNGVNNFIVLLSTYAILLNKLSNQSKIIIGVPFLNRKRSEFSKTFGCFVNTLPLLVDFSEDITGKALFKQVLNSLLKIQQNEEVPYLLLNSYLGPGDGSGLFQAGFTYYSELQLPLYGVEVKQRIFEHKGAQLNLFFSFWEENNEYHSFIQYSSVLFNREIVRGFWSIYQTILRSLIDEPNQLLSYFNITPQEDLDLIYEMNRTEVECADNICIHKKFEEQVKRTPDSPAILFNDQLLTYSEFNEHCNRMANRLIRDGIKVEDVICICIDRSVEMMVAVFGVLKAGAAYLPLSSDTPSERLKSIINDANPKLILTTKNSCYNIPDGSSLLFIDDILNNPLSDDITTPAVNVNSKNLAYIIYTSGSTGVPKGVMIEHHSVLNRLGWMQKAYPIGKSDTLMQKTPVTFDVSVWELFWWSFNGARLVLLPFGGEKNPETIVKCIEDYNVTTIHFVPSMFMAFFEVLKSRDLFGKLRNLTRIFMSGEALPLKIVEEFNQIRKDFILPDIINLYGPTEATVDVSYYNCPKSNINHVFIGRPIDNTKLFVLNNRMKIQPVGIPGELIITGVNLARGYMNHPELTRDKFFDFKISNDRVIRAYRTGDLVKLTSEGEIDYIGRLDNQVKIRGFRIELGDIEAKILEHTDVINCAVVVAEYIEPKSLIAYICLKSEASMESEYIRKFLSDKLPGYMVPSYFVFLDKLPLTTSGKVNRKALPKPDLKRTGIPVVLPTNNYEKELLDIWKKLLRIENISIQDNFFEVGGNSLLAINLATLISKEFGIIVNTITVLEHPNIKAQSSYISGLANQDRRTVSQDVSAKMERRKNIEFQRRRK
ncbi:MAG: amino acid adenylation domain-containing protein [Bacteroidales bacterium]|nr:amino acid adenylation domain-containing protein [Bacteroidales bacterium]